MQYLDEINEKKLKRKAELRQDYEVDKIVSANKDSARKIVEAVDKTHNVRVVNQQKVDIEHNIDFKPVVDGLTSLKTAIDGVPSKILIPKTEAVKVTNLKDYRPQIDDLLNAVRSIELNPNINVSAPDVKVEGTTLDTKSLEKKFTDFATKLDESIKSISISNDFDTSSLENAVKSVKSAVNSLEFPVPNYVLPFLAADGSSTQVQLDAGGNLPISASISGADGAITDGVNSSIKATVIESTDDPGTFGLVALQSDGSNISGGGGGGGGDVNLDEVGGTSTAVNTGNASAGTQRVVLASDQPTVDVDTGLTQPTTPSDTQPVSASSLPLPTGAATAANQLPDGHNVTVDNASIAVTGTFWQTTQPVSASSLPLPTGAATSALQTTGNSTLTTIATNTGVRGSSSAVTSVSGSASSVQLIAAASTRKEITITNDSSADLYVKLGTTASTTSYTIKLGQDESYINDKYTGRIDGIWSSATGAARITQVT